MAILQEVFRPAILTVHVSRLASHVNLRKAIPIAFPLLPQEAQWRRHCVV